MTQIKKPERALVPMDPSLLLYRGQPTDTIKDAAEISIEFELAGFVFNGTVVERKIFDGDSVQAMIGRYLKQRGDK